MDTAFGPGLGTSLIPPRNTSWHLVKDSIACESRGEVVVKGVHFPIGLYLLPATGLQVHPA